jgi:Zn ribbon nucleic-acid-binding protein
VTEWHQFDCPECPAAFEVDATVMAEVQALGCVECGAPVSQSAFSPLDCPPPAVE